jgi:hypothetical protein
MTPDYLPQAPTVTEPGPVAQIGEGDLPLAHMDYDRRPLGVEHLEHYIDLKTEYQRFRIG